MALFSYIFGCYMVILVEGTQFVLTDGPFIDGVIMSRNYIAATLVWGLPLAWYLTMYCTNRQWDKFRYVAGAYIPIASITILMTRSRQGAVALIIAIVFVLMMGDYSKQRMKRSAGIAAAGTVGGIFILYTVFTNRFMTAIPLNRIQRTISFLLGNISAKEAELDGRFDIYEAGIEVFQSNLFFGSGMGSYRTAAGQVGPGSQPHSTYLAVAAESGVIGVILFLLLIFMLLRGLLDFKTPEKMMGFSVLVLYLTISVVKTWWFDFTSLFLVTVVLLTARSRYNGSVSD